MKKILTAMVAGGLGLMASAATVELTFARQQWPWQHHFEINYVLKTDADEACDVSLKVSAAGEEFAIPATELLGETAGLSSGGYTLVWDSTKSAAPTAAWLAAHSGDLTFSVVTTPSANPNEYLVIDLSGGSTAASWPAVRQIGKPKAGWSDEYKTTKLVLRRIMCGGRGDTFSSATGVQFQFGTPSDDTAKASYDFAAVTATLTNDYYIGVFELTQKQYQLITGTTVAQAQNCFSEGPMRPQANISYYAHMRGETNGILWPKSSAVDANSLMGILRAKVALPESIPSEWKFDLPTEAQWEYACRAGTTGPWNNGKPYDPYTSSGGVAGDHNLDLVSWNPAIPNLSGGKDVGLKLPNAWGLYDMHGNASEFCLDYNTNSSVDRTKPETPGYNPASLSATPQRVVKGCAYSSYYTTVESHKYWVGHRSCAHVQTYGGKSTSGGVINGYASCRITLRNSAANAAIPE